MLYSFQALGVNQTSEARVIKVSSIIIMNHIIRPGMILDAASVVSSAISNVTYYEVFPAGFTATVSL